MHTTEIIARTLAVGVGATLVMDGWGLAQKHVLGTAAPDFALVGRWIGHMRQGRFAHAAITKAASQPGERALGWFAHYATGMAFAAVLPLAWGTDWLRAPSVIPALLVGLATVAAPFLLMQPAFGLGFAASKTPRPWKARQRSLVTHLVFGAGLYVAGAAAAQI